MTSAIHDDQLRMITEHRELAENVTKLIGFIGSDAFPTLDQIDRQLLIDQLEYMSLYGMTLGMRIKRFRRKSDGAG